MQLRRFGLGLAFGLVLVSVGSAQAATIPYALSITDGTQTATLTTLTGDYTYTPNSSGGSYTLNSAFALQTGMLNSWTSNYSDPTVSNNFNITNNMSTAQTYTVTVTSPGTVASPSQMSGSVGLTITNGSSSTATLGSSSPNAVYTALIDGASNQTLFNNPFSLTCSGAFCSTSNSASFGVPTPISGPAVTSSIGITIQFTLTPGASAGITSVFNVVPEPATSALLGLGILSLVALKGGRRQDS